MTTDSTPPPARYRRKPAASLWGVSLFLAACNNSGLSADLSLTPSMQASAVVAVASASSNNSSLTSSASEHGDRIANDQSALWSSPEITPAVPLPSGDGVSTTASSAGQLLQSGNGIYYGGREAREDWPGLIRRYSSDAGVANWVNKTERPRVDAWMARSFEKDHLVGGWTQAYVGSNGISMTWSPTAPEPADDASAGDFRSVHGAWVAWSRNYNIDQMRAAARLYRLTGEAKYASWAAQQLDFYASNYRRWPQRTHEGRSSLFAQGLDEATIVFPLIDTARLLEDYAGEQRYNEWRDKLFMAMAANLKLTSAPMSNIQLWHQAAISAIAMRYGDKTLLNEALDGAQGIKAVMARCLQADNFWIEGTFSYNDYVVQALSGLLIQAGVEGYGSRFAGVRDQAARMLLVGIDYRFDDNSLPNPNDSSGAHQVINRSVHWTLYRTAPTYWGLQLANEWRNWDSLLDAPTAVPAKAPVLPTARTRNFPTVRMAILRAGAWQAFIHYGQTVGNHVSDELTTFELHDGMTALARDPGTVSYASPYHKEYFQRGAANNVPLIDGDGQTRWAPGTLRTFDAERNVLTVEQPGYQPNASVTRSYRLTSMGFVERSDISVPNHASRRLGVIFNTSCRITLGEGTTPGSIQQPLPDVPAFRKYWTQVALSSGAARWEAQIDCDGRHYTMTVNGPAGQRIYTARVPDTPLPTMRNAVYYEVDAAQTTFETEFKAKK